MLTLLYFLLYLGAALLVTAQLYYPVFQAVDAFREVRPEQLFYRLAMLVAAVGFWPFLKMLGINNRYALGYSLKSGPFLQTCARGLVIGVVIMLVHGALLLILGVRVLEPDRFEFSRLAYTLSTGLVSGLLVAFIEETLFRGAMQYGIRYSNTLLVTATGTSLVYAAVHFLHPPALPQGSVIGWSSGWEMLVGMFHQYRGYTGFVDSFIALFAAGLLLSLVRERTGNIALCIGIHAGWVMMIKLARDVSTADPAASSAFLIGSYDGIIGWAAAGVLTLVTAWYWYSFYRR